MTDDNYKLGPICSFRLFPDNYHSLSLEEKEICDKEFLASVADNSKKHRNLFYYAEVIYEDSAYETITSTLNSIFIGKANLVHKDKYDYSLVDYINSKEHIKIKCPIHGVFEQRPTNHLQGQGCVRCAKISKKMKNNNDVVIDENSTNPEEFTEEFISFLKWLK